MRASIGVLGLCSGLGQKKHGLEEAPRWIRKHCLRDAAFCSDDMVDYGDLYPVEGDCSRGVMTDFLVRSFDAALNILKEEKTLLTIGGDHSVAIASIGASLQLNPLMKVIWIDAHGDMNTPETSVSKNFHGMPLAALLGEFSSDLRIERDLLPSNLLLVGVRDLDEPEQRLTERLGLQVITTKDIQTELDSVIQRIKSWLGPDSDVHISFDVDVLDPFFFSATGTPVREGIQLESCNEILRAIKMASSIRAFDFVEFNPSLITDDSNFVRNRQTAQAILSILFPD